MKKVLQIPNYLYPHIGGIEQVAKDIADTLQGQNIEQKIICFNEDAEDENIVCHRKETVHDYIDGVEVIRCGCIAKVASQSLSLTYSTELKKVLNEFLPDIVIFHYPNPFVASFLMKYIKRKNFKFVLYWHLDITKQKLLGKLFHYQNLELIKYADQVVATSPNYVEGSPYLSANKDKCMVIPNCINKERLEVTDAIRKIAERIRDENAGKVICFAVGRHVEYKGMEYLIRASKLLDDNYKVFIAGKGPLTEQLESLAAGDNKIEFLGRIDNDLLIAYYVAMDIFCFPSITKNEAFGIALAEGMYFEKPAVTFTIPGSGVNYVNLNGETGIEVPNRDVEKYAEALEKLAQSKELRMQYGQAAKRWVVENFMQTQFVDRIKKLLG